MQPSNRFSKLVNSIKDSVKEIAPQDVHTLLKNPENFILIDVREDNEWHEGHLPQAIHLSRGILECNIEQKVPDTEKRIILYCRSGSRSALAANSLEKMGYTKVQSMKGGFMDWVKGNYPIDKG